MESDRELLELAARAANINGKYIKNAPFDPEDCIRTRGIDRPWGIWNPLIEDGDALRLAVNLKIDVTYNDIFVIAFPTEQDTDGCAEPYYCSDPYAATRRAIVRVAAEIGRAMS